MKIGAIVQARVSSTRLPGKVLKELPFGSGITVLEQVLRRLQQSKRLDAVIVATTNEKEDTRIIKIAQKQAVIWFRGSKDDVLSRYYLAAKENSLDIIVRVTSDCPCIDPKIVDITVEKHLQTKSEFTSNNYKETYPLGLGVEVFNFSTLEEASQKAEKDFEKEHVSPYIYRHSRDFKVTYLEAPPELSAPDIRITVDTDEDYALLCAVFDYLYAKDAYFDAYSIIGLFKQKPWLKLINKEILQKKIFGTLEEEIQEAIKILDLQDLKKTRDILKQYS